MFGYLLLFFPVFVVNIWLINHGSGFTIPREMLFRNYAPLALPILAFPIILTALFLVRKFYFKLEGRISPKIKKALLVVFLLASSFSLFFTVQTNPDYGLYQREAKYFVENGPRAFLANWGTFSCYFNMPLISFFRGVTFWLFGEGPVAVLLGNLLIVAGILFFTYKIANRLFGQKIALVAVVLLATTPFFITQTPLFLVDLGVTFFVTLSVYLLLRLIDQPSLAWVLLTGVVLFFTAITKVFGVIYLVFLLAGFSFFLLMEKKDKEAWLGFLSAWLVMGTLSLGYLFWKLPLFWIMIENLVGTQSVVRLLIPLVLVLLGGVGYFFKREKISQALEKIYPFLVPAVYLVLGYLFFFGQRSRFYLRTIMVGGSLPLALLFFASFYFVIKKKSSSGFLLLFWVWSIMAVPNTMFKYQLPTYPAIMILASLALFSLIKTAQNRVNYLLVTLAFSFTITYTFFLPMINTHVKNNVRQAARFINQQEAKSLALTPFLVGDYGQMLIRSFEEPDRCPHPPSLVDITDFYTPAQVSYWPKEQLQEKLDSGKDLPEAVFLIYHLDLPFEEEKELYSDLRRYYQEGPLFDQAKGSGIWRVKIKTFYRSGQ